jgi:hypothetical protein
MQLVPRFFNVTQSEILDDIPGCCRVASPEPMNTTLAVTVWLVRLSTSSLVEARVQDVDARHKGEQDELGQPRPRNDGEGFG